MLINWFILVWFWTFWRNKGI